MREFVAGILRTGLGTYKYNAEQVHHYRSEFEKLTVRARKLVETIAALQRS